MGMDVFGLNPTGERGKYFRNNVWWWHPLWDYCSNIAVDLINDETYISGHHNEGAGLDAEAATELGRRLLDEINSGNTAVFEMEYRGDLASMPLEDCDFCNGTGIRNDELGIKFGWHDRVLPEEVAIVVGRTHGSCSGCSGFGKRRNPQTNYPFDVRNVEEFALFCLESGGFEIL